ncbi:MAG TPA: hypothetical protein PLX21_15670 [Rhodocyclaceae bacterium]|nr:hypothetical protein [Rhodocyclaceae bacterium]
MITELPLSEFEEQSYDLEGIGLPNCFFLIEEGPEFSLFGDDCFFDVPDGDLTKISRIEGDKILIISLDQEESISLTPAQFEAIKKIIDTWKQSANASKDS